MDNKINVIAIGLVLISIITHYVDYVLGISASGNSISVGLLASGTTLINFQGSN